MIAATMLGLVLTEAPATALEFSRSAERPFPVLGPSDDAAARLRGHGRHWPMRNMPPFAPIAETTDPSSAACDAPLTESAMTLCARRTFEQADAVLDQAYADARSTMAARSAGLSVLLENAQSAWVPYRDRSCAAEAAPFDSASLQALITFNCLTRLTERRAADLAAMAEQWQ
ncbi:MAG: lysozyme inhibitor LprI family protein [Pseudomonadota bacterium]